MNMHSGPNLFGLWLDEFGSTLGVLIRPVVADSVLLCDDLGKRYIVCGV